MNVILEESEPNITSGLVEISVPCSRIAEESPTTSGTNPQTLTNSHSACPRKTPLLLFTSSDISPVPDTFCRKQTANKTFATPERICCYLDQLALQKQTSRRP
jgi:hypothetical protein